MMAVAEMINNGTLETNQYFTMHPFSATENTLYRQAFGNLDFFKSLYVTSNKTYERLATVCHSINNAARNMIVVTGYRGCGKTNFLRLLEYIFSGGRHVTSIIQAKEEALQLVEKNDENVNNINNAYADSIRIIETKLPQKFYLSSTAEICEHFMEYIYDQFVGTCTYINFDAGGVGEERPFNKKMFYLLRESIERDIATGLQEEIIELIYGFTKRNRWIIQKNFVNKSDVTLDRFLLNVCQKMRELSLLDDFYTWLNSVTKETTLEHLLFLYVLWEYSALLASKKENGDSKLVYLLDNIDIISDGVTDIFTNTMSGIWNFLWDTSQAFDEIENNSNLEDNAFAQLYHKTKFVVAMRETTAMHISGHLRDKMRNMMEHFDMSIDVDKSEVMQKRVKLARKMISQGAITNEAFVDAIRCIENMLEDRGLMRNLFWLHNNDYRTAISSLITICMEHLPLVEKSSMLIKHTDNYVRFGGRGIIYKLLTEAFFQWNYFGVIGIQRQKYSQKLSFDKERYGYSCARIILTLLCNKQAKVPERFFVNPEESVRMRDLYSMVKDIMKMEDFISVIDGMYSLRNKRFWSHMVTFDNILCYSSDQVEQHLTYIDNEPNKDREIYIRATSAGQFFVGTLCTHFEYFATRFSTASQGKPLFSLERLDDARTWGSLQRIISDVYDAVEKCCTNLENYNKTVLRIRAESDYSQIVASPYFYEAQLHEERIIHNHISYLEAYRQYINTSSISEKRLKEANNFLLQTMQKYLDLLRYDTTWEVKAYRDLFISENSKYLYNELNVCIEEIRNKQAHRSVLITRDFYRNNYKGKLCKGICDAGVDITYSE